MNQVEQWFSILTRKRLAIPNFPDTTVLAGKIQQFIEEWNVAAKPFDWTPASFAKILAKAEAEAAAAKVAA